MLTLPAVFINLLAPFMPAFQSQTWAKAQLLLVGAVLSPGKRTVTTALRVLGLGQEAGFAKYHHVLNRARWSSLGLSKVLLFLLLRHLDPSQGPLVFGIDETLERRWGRRISARGIYRDAVRSSASHFVKASGLRWISLMWLPLIPWSQRVWALPVLTALAPSERYYQNLKRRPKKLTDWARQIILQLRRWLPHRPLVLLGDRSYAVLELLHFCQSLTHPVTFITRLRLDAALYEPAAPRQPHQKGRTRRKGARLPTLQQRLQLPETSWTGVVVPWYDGSHRLLEIASDTAVWYHSGLPPVPIRWVLIRDPLGEFQPQALLCTDPQVAPAQVIQWFVLRWQLEVTFQEVRAHLGVETQRQWSDLAIARTTPVLLGLFSWVTLTAHLLQETAPISIRHTAWYPKPLPTFSDAIAQVRQKLWPCSETFCMSPSQADMVKIPRPLLTRLLDTVSYAA
jgi:hypothetical protein